MQWASSKAEIVAASGQVACAVLSAIAAFPELREGRVFSKGAILFYVLVGLVLYTFTKIVAPVAAAAAHRLRFGPIAAPSAPTRTPRTGISMVMCGQGKKYNLGTPGNGQHEFKIAARPRKLFFEAGMQMVTEDDLQKDIRFGSTKFRIKRFTDEGFVVDDFGVAVGFEVWVLDWIAKT